MMRSLSLSLCILLLLAGSIFVAAIEIESSQDAGSPKSTFPTSGLPRASPCVDSCSAQLSACNENCVFNSMNESEEMACRTACYQDVTPCVERCAQRQSKEQAAAKLHKSKNPNTFESRGPQPRPPTENVGFGPEKVLNWAGYQSINGSAPGLKRHLWYWAFESRNDPSKDPLVIWLTGGPGCSSLVALFYEHGPYHIQDDLSLSLNPYSWNSNATVIYIDQPVNTGYSYADNGDWGAFSEAEIADNLFWFLQGWLEQYPKYQELPFYITGESYAGHYVPAFAARLVAARSDPNVLPINFQAVGIGNGLVNPLRQYQQYLPYAAAMNILPQSSLDSMAQGLPACVAAINSCNQTSLAGLIGCLQATETCNLSQMMPFELTGLNVYDVREKCAIPPLCYNFTNVDNFLAQPEVIQALGVQGHNWQDCNRLVDLELIFAGDWMRNLADDVTTILESGVRVVVYSGEDDFICNWYGGFDWTMNLQWSGANQFRAAENTTWISTDGQPAGSSRTAQGLTFVRVFEAGHMVPLNQPERALDLLGRIISGQPFDPSQPIKKVESTNSNTKPSSPSSSHRRSHETTRPTIARE